MYALRDESLGRKSRRTPGEAQKDVDIEKADRTESENQ
jgi:hypothetical protein